MKLKTLHIYEDYMKSGKYNGTIEVTGEYGKVELKLSPEQIEKIVRVVASELVETAKEVAQTLTAECIEYRDQKTIQG